MSATKAQDPPSTEVTSRDIGMQLKMKKLLVSFLDDIIKKNKQKAQHTLLQFTNTYGKYEVAFKLNKFPRRLIKLSIDISNILQETVKKVKQFNKILNDWKKFIDRFNDQIEPYKEQLSELDHYDEDEEEDENQPVSKGFYKQEESDVLPNEHTQNPVVLCHRLYHKCEAAREKGQPHGISVSKLYEASKLIEVDFIFPNTDYNNEEEEQEDPEKAEVRHLKIHLLEECCKILSKMPENNNYLTPGQWEVALNVVRDCALKNDLAVPILKRLTFDMMHRGRQISAATVGFDEIYLFKPTLIELIQNQIEVNQRGYSNVTKSFIQFELYDLLCQLVSNSGETVSHPLLLDTVISLFQYFRDSRKMTNIYFQRIFVNNLVYLIIDLSYKRHDISASVIYQLLPQTLKSDDTPIDRIYKARARACIGLNAFKDRHYTTAYAYLREFSKISQIPKVLGQNPPLVESWLFFDINELSIFRQLSKELSAKQLPTANSYQELQAIWMKAKDAKIELFEECKNDVKFMIATTFYLSCHSTPDEKSVIYLKDTFDLEEEMLPKAAQKADEIRQGQTDIIEFATENPAQEDQDIAAKVDLIKGYINDFLSS